MRLWTDVGLNPKSISAEMHTESRMVSLHVGKQEGDLPASITMTFDEWDIFAQRIQSEHERLETERSAPRHTDKNGKAIIHESTEWFFPGHDPYTGKELPRTRAMEQSSPGRDPDTDKKPSRVRPERSWGMGKIIWLVVEGMMGIFALVFLTLFASIGDLVTVVVGTLFGTAMIGSLVIGTLREDERIPLWRE